MHSKLFQMQNKTILKRIQLTSLILIDCSSLSDALTEDSEVSSSDLTVGPPVITVPYPIVCINSVGVLRSVFVSVVSDFSDSSSSPSSSSSEKCMRSEDSMVSSTPLRDPRGVCSVSRDWRPVSSKVPCKEIVLSSIIWASKACKYKENVLCL